MQLHELADKVSDETSFLIFVKALHEDRGRAARLEKEKPSSAYGPDAGGWENTTIEHFLESSVAWAEDTNFGRKLENSEHELKDVPQWRRLASFLLAGKVYE